MPHRTPPQGDRDLLEVFWSEPVDRLTLANGLTLIVKPDRPAGLVSVQVWVRTGSIHEGQHLGAGLSHFVEHMLFKGTSRRAAREISATIQAHGGYINAYTTFDRTVYYVDLPSEHLEVAVDVLADAVLHSTLPAEEVAREKDVILREIAMTRDDPDTRLWEAVFAAAFREHPYQHPIIGHRDVFAAVDREALARYYQTRYVPNNLVVVIAGDTDLLRAREAVERHFGGTPRASVAPVLVPAEPAQFAPRTVRRREEVDLVRGVLAWPIPGLTDPVAPALDLLGMVLGHGDSSVLWRELRDRLRLVHTIDASSWNPGSSGLFCISFTCDAGKLAQAEAAIERVIASFLGKKRFSPEEVRKAYRQSLVAEINTCKTVSGQASRLGVAEVVAGDLGFGKSYLERLRRVRPADLKAALKAHVVPARKIAVSIEPLNAPKPAGPASARLPRSRQDFGSVELPNGAKIIFQPDRRLPNLHLRLVTAGGPATEPKGRRGSAALLATLLSKDTKRRSAAAVARRIEEAGGSFSSYSGDNSLGLSVEVLPRDAALALELLAEGALEPAFKKGTLETERDAQLAALREENDDVVSFARRRLRREFFGTHPLAVGSSGEPEGVKATSAKDLSSLWKELLVGPGAVLAVTGDFDPDRLLPKLEAFLKAVPPGSKPRGAPAFVPGKARDWVEIQKREQAVVLQGFPGPSLFDADFFAGELADELFSGMASQLFENVRERKGLAYFVRSGRVTGTTAGMFYFISGTAPGKEAQVLEEIGLEIARVRGGGVGAAELDRCKARLKAGRRSALQSNGARAGQAAFDALLGRGENYWKLYDASVDAVSLEDLARFASTRLGPEHRSQLVVRP